MGKLSYGEKREIYNEAFEHLAKLTDDQEHKGQEILQMVDAMGEALRSGKDEMYINLKTISDSLKD